MPRRKGSKVSEATKLKISQSKMGKKHPKIAGRLHWNWKGDKISRAGGYCRAWKQFLCPEGKERHHIDGDPTNNDPVNIEFLTHKEHMVKDGRLAKWNIFLHRQNRPPMSIEAREKIAKACQGTKTSAETKAKLSAMWTGKPRRKFKVGQTCKCLHSSAFRGDASFTIVDVNRYFPVGNGKHRSVYVVEYDDGKRDQIPVRHEGGYQMVCIEQPAVLTKREAGT